MRSNAPNIAGKQRFFTAPKLVLFAVISVSLMIAFFPRDEISVYFYQPFQITPVTVKYLNDILEKYADNIVDVRLDRDNITPNDYQKIYNNMMMILKIQPVTHRDWEAQWIAYQVFQWLTFSQEKNGAMRVTSEANLKIEIQKLMTGPFLPAHFQVLANDSLALGNPYLAFQVYQAWLKIEPEQPADFYVNMAKTAQFSSLYQQASIYYFLAQQKSQDMIEKRKLFMLGVQSLMADNLHAEAMMQAEANLGELKNDRETLIFLSKAALQSGRPDLAKKYITKALE